MEKNEITIKINETISLKGNLSIPENPKALVIFSHGSGSSRFSSRNRFVAQILNKHNIATLLTDLLTEDEDLDYSKRFDIELLTDRLVSVTNYVIGLSNLKGLEIGFFGASTGAASALKAETILNGKIHAIVSRGGRPDLAGESISNVKASTLLIIGSLDNQVIYLNKKAFEDLMCVKQIILVKDATHLFEEPGKLNEVAELAVRWFSKYLFKKSELVAF